MGLVSSIVGNDAAEAIEDILRVYRKLYDEEAVEILQQWVEDSRDALEDDIANENTHHPVSTETRAQLDHVFILLGTLEKFLDKRLTEVRDLDAPDDEGPTESLASTSPRSD